MDTPETAPLKELAMRPIAVTLVLVVFTLLSPPVAYAVKIPVGDIAIDPNPVLDPGREPLQFRRGDVRADGNIALSDAITLLRHLFFGDPATLPCADAADTDDDGILTIGDAVAILSHLYSGSKQIRGPVVACGADPTNDFLGCDSFPACIADPAPSDAEKRLDMAYHYAPVHHQDASDSGYRYDMLARIDFNGNWDMASKWEAAATMGVPAAHVYYSVVSTATHWYLVYAFYHPRDWTNESFDQEHENDMEGLLLVVFRDGSRYGKLEAAVTVAHLDFYSYTPGPTHLSAGAEDLDGNLGLIDGSHPLTYQEAKGHGVYAYGGSHTEDGDGIWYYPSLPYLGHEEATRPALPTPQSGDTNPKAHYKLLDIFEAGGLWDRRENAETFHSFGSFRGDDGGECGDGVTVTCSENSPHPPWGWDDVNDGPVFAGELAFDPAHLVGRYFHVTTAFARDYERNPYAVEIVLEELTVLSNQDPSGDRSDPYFNLYFGDGVGEETHGGYGDGIVDGDSGAQVSWVLWDPPMSTRINLATAMPRNRFYTIKSTVPTFRIRVMDWDNGSGDEWLMSPAQPYAEERTSGSFTYEFGRSRLKVRLTDAPGGR